MCVGCKYFGHRRRLHKYPRVAKGRAGVEVKSMIDSAHEEGSAALCAGCEGGERNGIRPLRYVLYCVKSG